MMDGWSDNDDLPESGIDAAVEAICPHCGEPMSLAVDPDGGALQEYIEDCSVCCRPSVIRVRLGVDGEVEVEVEATE